MSKILIFPPAELNRSHNIVSIVELVIGHTQHLEILVYCCSSQDLDDTFVSQMVTVKIYFLKLAYSKTVVKYKNLLPL